MVSHWTHLLWSKSKCDCTQHPLQHWSGFRLWSICHRQHAWGNTMWLTMFFKNYFIQILCTVHPFHVPQCSPVTHGTCMLWKLMKHTQRLFYFLNICRIVIISLEVTALVQHSSDHLQDLEAVFRFGTKVRFSIHMTTIFHANLFRTNLAVWESPLTHVNHILL